MASATSLRSKVDSLSTHGQENSHEIQVGRSIADILCIPHKTNILKPKQFSPVAVLVFIRYHGFHHEISICSVDGLTRAAKKSRLIFADAAGEIYRRHCKPYMDVHLKNKQ